MIRRRIRAIEMFIHRCMALDGSSRRTCVCVGFFILSNFFTAVIVTRYNSYQEPCELVQMS